MKYLIRAVKYYIKLCILVSLLLAILVFIGAAEGNPETMFRDGYKSIAQIALLFAAFSAIYPKVGYISRKTALAGEWSDYKGEIITQLENRGYIIETEEAGKLTFRIKGFGARFAKSFEDRISITAIPGGIETEGLRKDVLHILAGLDRIQDRNNE